MNQEQKKLFIESLLEGALDGHRRYGLLPSVTMAQAALESGWGGSCVGFNLFGVKATSSWKGKTVTAPTKEWRNGRLVQTRAAFRAYASFSESLADHNRLIGESPRYRPVTEASGYAQACRALKSCGYATDPEYAVKLMQIIESNRLHVHDPSPPHTDPPPKALLNLPSPWAEKARDWAVESGISDGKRPKAPATREELWLMLYRSASKA